MKIRNHRLCDDSGAALDYRKSPNQSAGAITPEYLVVHYTAGDSAAESIRWLMDSRARASAHLVIGRDGGVTQLVAFNRKAWHAGASQWDGRLGVNGFSVGIELDNAGRLEGAPGNWRTWKGSPVDDADVVVLPHEFDGKERGWQRYDPRQIKAAIEVSTLLVNKYGLKGVVGHEDISPGRKWDPGPAFPMPSFRSAVTGRAEDEPHAYETTTALNIRSGPGASFDKLPASPLPLGTKLRVLSTSGLWLEVDVLDTVGSDMDVTGWVHGRHVRRI